MFESLQASRLSAPYTDGLMRLASSAELYPCPPLEYGGAHAIGFADPWLEAPTRVVTLPHGAIVVWVRIETRSVKASQVDAIVRSRLEAEAIERGRPATASEKLVVTRDVQRKVWETTRSAEVMVPVYVDPRHELLFVGTRSLDHRREVMEFIRQAVQCAPPWIHVFDKFNLRKLMTAWVAGAPRPDDINLGTQATLMHPAMKGAQLRIKNLDADVSALRQAIADRMLVDSLQLHVNSLQFIWDRTGLISKIGISKEGAVRFTDDVPEDFTPAVEREQTLVWMLTALRQVVGVLHAAALAVHVPETPSAEAPETEPLHAAPELPA